MDIEKAKAFIFNDSVVNVHSNAIYKSKVLQRLLDKNNGKLIFIYAIIETESGEMLMEMDWSYSGDPIIMHKVIHLEFYMKFYRNCELIDLDK